MCTHTHEYLSSVSSPQDGSSEKAFIDTLRFFSPSAYSLQKIIALTSIYCNMLKYGTCSQTERDQP